MSNKNHSLKAIHDLHGKPYKGRELKISLAVDQRIYMNSKNSAIEVPAPVIENNGMEIEELDKAEANIEQPVPVQTTNKKAAGKPKKDPIVENNEPMNKEVNEKEFSVISRKQQKTPEERMREMQATIFVQNLDFDMTEDAFYRHFRKLGQVKQAKVN